MDLLQMGAQMLKDKLGTDVDINSIVSALQGLLGGQGGQIDIASLVSQFTSAGGLQSVVDSWLGDGGNQGLDVGKITEMFGAGKLGEFASQVGVDQDQAAGGLAEVLPQLVDKVSSGGSLTDMVGSLGGSLGGGGAGGLFDAAKKLF